MKNNDITAIWLWKHRDSEDAPSARLEATVSTPQLMTKTDLIAQDNVSELIEQDDRIVAVDVFICDDVTTAKMQKDTVLETYRIRGLDETADIWPDVSVGQLEGGEGVLLLQSYEGRPRKEGKIRIHERRSPDISLGMDRRRLLGSWSLSRSEIAEADGWEPQFQAAQRAGRRISAQVATYEPRMSGIVVNEVQRNIEKEYGAIIGVLDVRTEDFEDDLERPETLEDGRELQAEIIQAAEDISDDLEDAKRAAKEKLLDQMQKNGSRFVVGAIAPTP